MTQLSEADVLAVRWFAVPETLIGGWAIATVDKPTHEIDCRPETDERVIGDVWGEATARHLVELHNASLA